MESSAQMANEHGRLPEVSDAALIGGYRKPEIKYTASGSDRLPEVDAVALVGRSETETSDGDQNEMDRRRHHRRRKYGRLKRIRLDGLALPVDDTATESESEKRFIVVASPEVDVFRSPTSSLATIAADKKDRSWLKRKFRNRKRKSESKRKPEPSKSRTLTTTKMRTEKRCERYLKQVVAALFSTLGLLCLMVAYTIFGGYVFCRLESSNEVAVKADMRQVKMLFIHSFIHSFMHLFINSVTRSITHSFIHSFIYSLIHSFVHSFIHIFTIHSFIYSLIRSFIYSYIHNSFIHLFTYLLIHSFIHSFIHIYQLK